MKQTSENQCGALLKQIHDMTEKHANNTLRGNDMTLSQLSVLIELTNAKDHTLALKSLEKQLLIAQSTTFGLVSRLEQKGFVEVFGDENDRRIRLVRITEPGIACVDASLAKRNELDALLTSSLTAAEKDKFIQILIKVRDTLKQNQPD